MYSFRTSYQRTKFVYAQTYGVSKKSAVYKHNLFLQCNIITAGHTLRYKCRERVNNRGPNMAAQR